MSWHVLHAGKFVDADGVVLDRAEHEFLARTPDFPEAFIRHIARQDPHRLPLVEWSLSKPVNAGFTQTSVMLDGKPWCLRVIDHQAFEGPKDRPGRGYRKRTYLLLPIAQWGDHDANLPVDMLLDPPQFTSHTTVEPWEPPTNGRIAPAKLRDDLEVLLGQGRLGYPAADTEAVQRIGSVLAALPPDVAGRLEVRIGEGDAIIQAPGPEAGDIADSGCGVAAMHILGNSRQVSKIARASRNMFQHAEPAWDLGRPFSEIRQELAWLVRCEAWMRDVDAALAAREQPPEPPLQPSDRLLKNALKLFIERDAVDRIGVLVGGAWQDAWRRIEAPAWQPVIDLLAGRTLDDDALTILCTLPLRDGVAEQATDAMLRDLDDRGHAVFVALLRSTRRWCLQLISAHRDVVVGHALLRLWQQANPHVAWSNHPLRDMDEGRMLQAVLDHKRLGVERRKAAAELGPAGADAIAALGDIEANAAWVAHTGLAGRPHATTPDDLAAALDWIAGRDVHPTPGMVDVWARFEAPVEVTTSLHHGVPPQALEACLQIAPERVQVDEPIMAVAALLAQGDRVDRHVWRQHHQGGPWNLLDPDAMLDAQNTVILDNLQGQAILGALCLYGGDVRPAWHRIQADTILQWLDDRRPIAPLAPLVAAGAAEPVAAALSAFLDPKRPARNPHGTPASVRDEARRMLDRAMGHIGLLKRGNVKRSAKRLVEAA